MYWYVLHSQHTLVDGEVESLCGIGIRSGWRLHDVAVVAEPPRGSKIVVVFRLLLLLLLLCHLPLPLPQLAVPPRLLLLLSPPAVPTALCIASKISTSLVGCASGFWQTNTPFAADSSQQRSSRHAPSQPMSSQRALPTNQLQNVHILNVPRNQRLLCNSQWRQVNASQIAKVVSVCHAIPR